MGTKSKKSTRKISLGVSSKLVTFLNSIEAEKREQLFQELFLNHGVDLKINPVGMLIVKTSRTDSGIITENLDILNRSKDPLTLERVYGAIVGGVEVTTEEGERTEWLDLSFRDKSGKTFSVKPKTENQKLLIENILDKKVVFANGASGTGKTMISTSVALKMLEKGLVKKIWITRPNLPSENFGFLPGDISSKMLPFFLPIYNIIDSLVGKERRIDYIDKGKIEILPVAFARGMNIGMIHPEILIVDESENLTLKQMFLMLSRIGSHKNSKIVLCGDSYQTDLKGADSTTLEKAEHILKGSDYVGFVNFTKIDVVRSQEVQDIVERFEKYDKGQKGR